MIFKERVLGPVGAASMALLLASPGLASDVTEEARVTESRILTQTYGAELKTALQTALAKGGPIEALDVCKDQAPLIASRLSRQSGANIERVSRRYRNPASAPEPWQVTVLEQFEAATEEDPSLPEYVEHDAGGTRYMKAIRIQPVCLVCHGEALSDDLRQALDEDYPHDQARNYTLGDLRGAFSVSWPVPDSNEPPVTTGEISSDTNSRANKEQIPK